MSTIGGRDNMGKCAAALAMMLITCTADPVMSAGYPKDNGRNERGCNLLDSVIPPWADSYNDSQSASRNRDHGEPGYHSYGGSVGNGVELSVCFPCKNEEDGKWVCVTEPGQLLTLNLTAVMPRVTAAGPGLSADHAYSLLIVDPDAFNPTNPVVRSVVHWIISNIPGSILPSQDASSLGTTVLHYIHPQKPTAFAPPPYGIHRYYALLFQQDTPNQNVQNVTTPLLFSTRNFTYMNHLETMPVAGSLFTVDIDA